MRVDDAGPMPLRDLRPVLRRVLTPPLVVLAALWMLLEEFLWVWVGALIARVAHLPAVARVEARIARLPPYAAMTLFAVPTALLVPVKLGALYLIAAGHAVLGIAILVIAKLALTAVITRLFALCRGQLLTVAWFARLHDWVLRLRADLYARVREMPGWHRARATVRLAAIIFRRLKAELGA
jgi:hypothetical protein